jgi:hypothetical protein
MARSECGTLGVEPLPAGVVDRWLPLMEAARLARRHKAQLHIDIARGRLAGRRVRHSPPGRNPEGWQIRLSELHRYVQQLGTGGGPRPQKPTTLDWEKLATLPDSSE